MGRSVGNLLTWNGNIGKWDPLMGVMIGSATGTPGRYLPPGLDPAHRQPYIYADGTPPPGAGKMPQPGQPGSPMIGPGGVPGGAGRLPQPNVAPSAPAPWVGGGQPGMQGPARPPPVTAPQGTLGTPGTQVFVNGQFTPQQYAQALPKAPPGG